MNQNNLNNELKNQEVKYIFDKSFNINYGHIELVTNPGILYLPRVLDSDPSKKA